MDAPVAAAVVTMDHYGRLIDMNPQAEQLFGHALADVQEIMLAEVLVPSRLRMQHMSGLSRYLNSGHGPVLGRAIQVPALHHDGHEFLVEMTIERMAGSEPALFKATIRPIADRGAVV